MLSRLHVRMKRKYKSQRTFHTVYLLIILVIGTTELMGNTSFGITVNGNVEVDFTMFQNVISSDGRMHLENQVGNLRFDLTTGQTKTVIPTGPGMNLVMGRDGQTHTEMQIGQMRQTIGKSGCDWLL